MDFDPARSTDDILPVVVSSPAFDKTHPDNTHFLQIENGLVSWWEFTCGVHGLCTVAKGLSEILRTEDALLFAVGKFEDTGSMEIVADIVFTALNKYGTGT